jgi:hypothetical protein
MDAYGMPSWASDMPTHQRWSEQVLVEGRWQPPHVSLSPAAVLVYAEPREPGAPVWTWKTRGGQRGHGDSLLQAQIKGLYAAICEEAIP